MRLSRLGRGIALLAAIWLGNSFATDTGAALDAALAGAHRSTAHKVRDQYRHPKETLLFFGLEAGMRVVELLPGPEGWYTEILAPVLRGAGQLVTVTPPADSPSDYLREHFVKFNAKLDENPSLYDKVNRRTMGKAGIDLGPPGSADMVVTFRSTHNWLRSGQFEAVYGAILEVLKPSGILGIEQHRGKDEADPIAAAEQGYVSQRYLISRLEALGFKLAGSSEINANPKDTKDYPEGVWSLPPVLRLGAHDRDKYLAIGESDRMTLKFIKPAL
ncbi:MAG: class I SAM-dependent methyltransferase [Gammaproteobacteria bacterium]